MRSPVIAFGIFAAAVSPTIVSAAPAPKAPPGGLNAKGIQDVSSSTVHMIARQVPGLPNIPGTPDIPALHTTSDSKHASSDKAHKKAKSKRAYDWGTAGGNAYTGSTGNAGGGSIVNYAHGNADDPDVMDGGLLVNDAGTNGAGDAMDSVSGDAGGGNGGGFGPGGNAYTGAAGPSHGGDVINHAEGIENTDANSGGDGDLSESGDALGGDADDFDDEDDLDDDDDLRKRSYDWGTAGGNAYTGSTSNASGGNIVNDASNDEGVMNAGGNAAGDAGMTLSGDAEGGNGGGHGPGGNAYTGATGKAHGGNVINNGGGIDNTVDMTSMTAANAAGDGSTSTSGDAQGGDASDNDFDDEDIDDDL